MVLTLRRRMFRLKVTAAVGVAAALCAGCTVVRVEGGRAHRYAGLLRIAPSSDAKLVTVATQTWGLAAGGRSLVVGYERSRTVIVPEGNKCALIAIIEPGAAALAHQLRALLDAHPHICFNGEYR